MLIILTQITFVAYNHTPTVMELQSKTITHMSPSTLCMEGFVCLSCSEPSSMQEPPPTTSSTSIAGTFPLNGLYCTSPSCVMASAAGKTGSFVKPHPDNIRYTGLVKVSSANDNHPASAKLESGVMDELMGMPAGKKSPASLLNLT